MRIARHLVACLVLAAPSCAFARGGGQVVGEAFSFLIMAAVFVGLIFGLLCGASETTTLPNWLLVPLCVIGGFCLLIPALLFILGIPLAVGAVACACASYLFRGRPYKMPPPEAAGQAGSGKLGAIAAYRPDLYYWTAATYVFWTVVSLLSFELLAFLAVPPLALFARDALQVFLPFIGPPLGVALAISVFGTAAFVWRLRHCRNLAPLVFNVILLSAFFVCADIHRYRLMTQSLQRHRPDVSHTTSFIESVLSHGARYRQPHAGFRKGAQTYHWSYAERDFVPD